MDGIRTAVGTIVALAGIVVLLFGLGMSTIAWRRKLPKLRQVMVAVAGLILLYVGMIILPYESGKEAVQQESRCVTPHPDIVTEIASFLDLEGKATLRGAQAVRTRDYERVWFVAADIQAPGLEGSDDVFVWATQSVDQMGSWINSVRGGSETVSKWPNDYGFTTADDGAREAKECTRELLAKEG